MWKMACILLLMTLYVAYSGLVYTRGTSSDMYLPAAEQLKAEKGKMLFQQYNCIACHQLYGLGGYLGPELTTAYSDPSRGELYMKTFLRAGGPRMPDFQFNEEDINAIISYLKYTDSTATSYKTNSRR
jgi:nitric oxide reductase subunit C